MADEDLGFSHGPNPRRARRRVVEELLDLGTRRRVCLVIAAAGWGKTATVSAWARETRSAWVRCVDEQSSVRLLGELREALQPHLPIPLWGDPAQRPSSEPGGARVAADLCDQLRDQLSEDLVLVIDDLQELRSQGEAAQLIDGMCRHAPDRLHLVLITRQEPPFPLQRLRGQGFVAEISAPELALDAEDIAGLLDNTIAEDPPGLAVRIRERTGGWPAAVNAAVELLRGIAPDQRLGVLEHLSRPGERLHDYLAEEVVASEPESVREVLRRVAIWGEAVSTTGPDDARALADLTRRGLVCRGRGRDMSWSLIQPLRDYFDHEAVLPAVERTALHLAASKECVARDAPAEAMRHLAAAGEHAECVALLREHGSTLVSSGQVAAVLEAAKLPAAYLDEPSVQRVLGEARQVAGQSAAAQEYFLRAGAHTETLEPALAWRMALAAFTQGEFHEVRRLYRRTRLVGEDTNDEARVLVLLAMSERMTGNLDGFRDATERAVAAARRCGEPAVWAKVHTVLAMQAGAEADRRRADAHWNHGLEAASACNDLLEISLIKVMRAGHLLEFGLPQRALVEAHSALEASERCDNLFAIAHALTTRGQANAQLGVLAPAVADFEAAAEIFQGFGSRFLARPLSALGDVHRTRGQRARARAAYEEALGVAEPSHYAFAIGSALSGLALMRAADDPTAARDMAERAVALNEGLLEVPAMLARGWVALSAGDRQTAASDAARAGSAAGTRRDNPGLAEALMLGALASDQPGAAGLFGQAIDMWRESGFLVDEATARVVAAQVGAPVADLGAERAHQKLRELGVDLAGRTAGPLAAARQSAPLVSIRTLGGFQVIHDGVPVPKSAWQSKKARDLLKVLVARRRPVPREQLVELLWPGADGARSGNRLSVLLSMVREVLHPRREGDGPLRTDGNSVWLDRKVVSVDVEEFLAQARRALEAHGRRARDAGALLVEAEAGYTGNFLEDGLYQEWAQPLSEEVRATHVALLRALGFRLREAGDVDGVVRYSLQLLAHDDYDEQAHLDLINVQLEAGHFGEARRRYRLYTQRMKEMRVVPRPMPVARRGASTDPKGPRGRPGVRYS